MVSENDDSPGLGPELGTPVLTAPHIQMFRLSDSVLASLIELPALEMPGGGVAPGMFLFYFTYNLPGKLNSM